MADPMWRRTAFGDLADFDDELVAVGRIGRHGDPKRLSSLVIRHRHRHLHDSAAPPGSGGAALDGRAGPPARRCSRPG